MSNPMKAADDLKSLAARFRGFLEVAEVLEKIGNLEHATREAERRKDSAYKEAEDSVGILGVKKQELADLNMSIEGAKAILSKQIQDAKERAEKIISDANEKALEIENDAESNRDRINDLVQAENSRVDELKKEAKRLEKNLAEIKTHIQETKRKMAEI